MTDPSTVDTFRILVADDDDAIHEIVKEETLHIRRELQRSCPIDVQSAATVKDAVNAIRTSYFDLLILDLHFHGNVLGGYEVYRKLDALGCNLDVMIMSRLDMVDMAPTVTTLISLFGNADGPNFVGFVDEQDKAPLWAEIRRRYERHTQTRFIVDNLALPAGLVARRRNQYNQRGGFPLRNDVGEIEVEIERLLRSLYLDVPTGARTSDIALHIEPIDRRGLSAAIVVNAGVGLSLSGADIDSPKHKTVLKIGPKIDILEEASRFQEFVRFGVELDQRVELLGLGMEDTLGGIVYSFAGGVHRQELRSLDEVLRTELADGRITISQKVLKQLFESRNWYSMTADRMRINAYFTDTYRTDLKRSAREGATYLQAMPADLGTQVTIDRRPHSRERSSGFTVRLPSCEPLELPDWTVLGLGVMGERTEASLVHGDMHGGNVMLELAPTRRARGASRASPKLDLRRVCLIDFRNAGAGPRCIDAVALEASIRLADSEALCRQDDESGEISFTPEMRLRRAGEVVRRYETELRLYRSLFLDDGEAPDDPWAVLAHTVLSGLISCFENLTMTEYLQVSIRYTIRHLGYDVPPVARTRILTWLGAQYTLALQLPHHHRPRNQP